jgi:hypothetical protein
MKFMKIKKENQIEKITLYGHMEVGEKTLWSKHLNNVDGINYIESRFRIHDENKTGKDTVGLKWTEGKFMLFIFQIQLQLTL